MSWIQLTAPIPRATIEDAQRRGLFPPQADVSLYASRADWGTQSAPSITFPEDGDTIKYWRYPSPRDENRHIRWTGKGLKASDPRTYEHPMWALFGPNAAQAANTYRQFAAEIDATGGIPELEEVTIGSAEAFRMNTKEGVTIPYPLGVHMADGSPTLPPYIFRINGGKLEAMQYQEFSTWAQQQRQQAATAASTASTAKPATSGTAPTGSAPSAPTGRTPIGDSAYIQWQADGTGERFNVNATDGKTVATGVRFKSYQGTIPEGGSWQNFDLTADTMQNLVARMAPHATLRSIVIQTGQATTDLGVHPDQQLVYSRPGGTKKVVRDASLIADRIAGKTPFTPLSTGAADPRDVEIGLELDDVARELEA